MTLPPEAAGVMQMLGPWPNFNEDDARQERDAVRSAHANTIPAVTGADSAVRATQQVYRGESAAAMQSHWERTGTQNGHVAQANAALKTAPAVLEGAAAVVSAVKVAAGTQAIYTSVELTKLLAFGGAVGATAATARVLLRRKVVGKILREGSEGTGKVIAPIVRRRITEPMRRVLEGLRRPGGPRPALAGAGGRNVPLRSAGMRESGPRSFKDGIAKMARKNNRDEGRGRGRGGGRGGSGSRGGGGFFSRRPSNSNSSGWRVENDGRIHGDPPSSAKGMTEQEAKSLRDKLKRSIKTRKQEEERKGYEVGHAERLRREEKTLRDLEESMRRREYDQPSSGGTSSGGQYNSGGSQASADRYPTDEEWEQHQRNRRW
ncbi:hypothetical protein [Nonomuraea sp. CA-141351]|uniref:WXG100-like domain-containing protein n=1 Tax=Nonomuraea sp. CA-141351 TaxID=3239996 RepID=UPI003D9347CB